MYSKKTIFFLRKKYLREQQTRASYNNENSIRNDAERKEKRLSQRL